MAKKPSKHTPDQPGTEASPAPLKPGMPNSQTPQVKGNKTVTTGESFWKAAGRFQPMR